VFHLDVAKVNLDVCIYMHVASVCLKCFRCIIRMLQVFYLDVAYICNDFQVFSRCFDVASVLAVSDICCKGVAKVDLVVHMLQ
jgi:hypothetical protein